MSRPALLAICTDTGTVKELADALLRLMDNPEEARRMGASAREHVLKNFSRQKFEDEIAETYLGCHARIMSEYRTTNLESLAP